MQGMAKFPLAHFWPVKLVTIIILAGFAMKGRGDTITVTNTADSGVGSFRQAILTANANPGLDTIVFQISGTPPFTIFAWVIAIVIMLAGLLAIRTLPISQYPPIAPPAGSAGRTRGSGAGFPRTAPGR